MNIFKIIISSAIVLIILTACTIRKELQIGEIAIIPKPVEQIGGEGYFEIDANTTISVENEEQAVIADRFFGQFKVVSGWKPTVSIGEGGDVTFITDSVLEAEGYTLNVTPTNIQITAAKGAGFFYATESLKQLLPISFYAGEKQPDMAWGVPVVNIKDAPAFGWRGYMLDVSRHFFDIEEVKKTIDFMAELKLNRFHWHLTDDQGWRIEIKSYPKLTEIGAWRVDHNVTDEAVYNWFGRPKQKPNEKPTYGGFYTQEDIKEIIAYAKERYIEVIPEIDMPGHSQALVASYPEMGCVNAEKFVATGGVVKNNTLNPGKEETFEFAEKMLNEVMDLFPYKYVHIGGDECNKNQWQVDPDAQQRMKEVGLRNEDELQSYFIKRIEKIINARGRIMIGWDEILEGGLAPNATVMSWRGEVGGTKSVKEGHEVIMTPSNYCYIDLKQGHDDLEPNLGYSRLLLSDSYNYQVIPEGLTEKEGKLIKGIQANMWTESISDWSKLTYMNFPRLQAVSESAWTAQSNKDWDDFTHRIAVQFKRFDIQHIRYAVSAFSPWIDHKGNGESIEISLKTEVNGLDIYYTTDGTEPTIQSTIYQTPFVVDQTVNLRAQSFKNGETVGYLSALDFVVHKAAGAKAIWHTKLGQQEIKELTDLNYGRLDNSDKNWNTFSGDMEIDILFDRPTDVNEVSFNALRFTVSGIYLPEEIDVLGSIDGKNFSELGTLNKKVAAQIQGRNKVNYTISFEQTKIMVLKVRAKAVSPIPQIHHRGGETSSIMLDEIVVN